jgi:hypothetical protein
MGCDYVEEGTQRTLSCQRNLGALWELPQAQVRYHQGPYSKASTPERRPESDKDAGPSRHATITCSASTRVER